MDLQVVVVDYEGIKWRETWHYVPFDTIELLGLGTITSNKNNVLGISTQHIKEKE